MDKLDLVIPLPPEKLKTSFSQLKLCPEQNFILMELRLKSDKEIAWEDFTKVLREIKKIPFHDEILENGKVPPIIVVLFHNLVFEKERPEKKTRIRTTE